MHVAYRLLSILGLVGGWLVFLRSSGFQLGWSCELAHGDFAL